MATRVTLGDNSARFDIRSTDTVTSIESVIRTFLNSRGWSLVDSAVNFGASTFTYSSTTMKGGTKLIRLAFFTSGSGSYTHLGISILNEVGSNETGYLANLFTSDPLYQFQTLLVKQSGSMVYLYCFANPRWCYFTSNRGSNVYDVNSDYFYSLDQGAVTSQTYTNPSYYDLRFTGSPIIVNGKVVSKSIPAEFYNNTSGVLDSIYSHCDNNPIAGTTYRTSPVHTNPVVTYTFARTSEKLKFSKFSLKGCTEILDTDSPTPFAILDTASLLTSFTDEKDIERAIKKELTNTYYKDSQKMLGNSFEMTTGNLTACYLLGDSTHYGDISLGVDNFKISGKNLISAIHTSSKNFGYTGKLYGMVLTQANQPSKFLQEKWLMVDENFNPSINGELRKFFVVPGYSVVSGNWNRRQWNFSASQTYYGYYRSVSKTWRLGNYDTGFFFIPRNKMNGALFIGDWQNNTSYFETADYYSFLIPA